MRGRLAVLVVVALGALTACGGEEEPPGSSAGAGDSETASPTSAGEVRLEEPTLTTEPGTAYAEVGGERLTYSSAASLAYVCDIGSDRVQVNFQTNEGDNLLLQVAAQDGQWVGNATFQSGAGENVQYSASIPGDVMSMLIGAEALSFEGAATRVEDFDAANASTVEAELAVNCAAPEGLPTATIGGETYTVDPNGAQSVTCTVAEDGIDILINRLSADGLQLEISSRREGDDLVGNVAVYTPEGTFTSPLPADGAGLEVAGATVTYEGTFTGPAGDERGTVEVTCPGP